MVEPVPSIDTPLGRFALRSQGDPDAPFLRKLFRDDCVAKLGLAGMPEAAIDQLVGFQYRSQTETHRALYPGAVYAIVAWQGEDIGRLVANDDGVTVYIVDIVLRTDRQGRGLGAALVGALMREWSARGRGARAEVVVTNLPSLKLWRRLGFAEQPIGDSRVNFTWPPAQAN